MKTAISVPDDTFARVETAAARLGVSRSHFYARAAERWLAELEASQVTEQINAALEAIEQEAAFVNHAAAASAERRE
jgi:hypothetical protein